MGRGLARIDGIEEDTGPVLGGGQVPDHSGSPQRGRQVQVEVGGWPVSPVVRPLMDPQHVGRARPQEPLQAGQDVDERDGQPTRSSGPAAGRSATWLRG